MRGIPVLLVLALVAAGCGGGTNTSSQTPVQNQGGPPLSKARFISKADALCRRFHHQVAPLRRQIETLPTPASSNEFQHDADLIRQYADTLAEQAGKLRQLQPPRADASVIDTWLSSGDAAISLFQSLATAFASSNLNQVRALNPQIQSQSNKASAIARGYGLKVCGHV